MLRSVLRRIPLGVAPHSLCCFFATSAGPTDPPQQPLKQKKFQQLLELNTEVALREAQRRIEQVEAKSKDISSNLDSMLKEISFLNQAITDSRLKADKLKDSLKEVQSSVQQTQKRAQKEVNDSHRFAVSKIAKELLEVADCLQSCRKFAVQRLNEAPEDDFCKKILECDEEMKKLLKKHEIEEINPMGQPYDPNTQESLLQIPCQPGYEKNCVGIVMRSGYLINGRLLRSARVGVFV